MKFDSSVIMLITASRRGKKKETARVTLCNFIYFCAEVSISFLCQAGDELYALMEF